MICVLSKNRIKMLVEDVMDAVRAGSGALHDEESVAVQALDARASQLAEVRRWMHDKSDPLACSENACSILQPRNCHPLSAGTDGLYQVGKAPVEYAYLRAIVMAHGWCIGERPAWLPQGCVYRMDDGPIWHTFLGPPFWECAIGEGGCLISN